MELSLVLLISFFMGLISVLPAGSMDCSQIFRVEEHQTITMNWTLQEITFDSNIPLYITRRDVSPILTLVKFAFGSLTDSDAGDNVKPAGDRKEWFGITVESVQVSHAGIYTLVSEG